MPPAFKPPIDDADFNKRADVMTLDGARTLLKAVKSRRKDALKPFDQEIDFLEKVIEKKEAQA